MFYQKGINLSNAKQMFEFITGHFTYDTMNSWNRLESIANNVKLYNLHLDGDWSNAMGYLFDEYDIGGLQEEISDMIKDWEYWHPGYSLGFNGRSGGYLVIYNKEKDGRVNFRNILPDFLQDDNYENFKEDCKEYYGGVKARLSDLRFYTELIRDFDKLCDDMTKLVSKYSLMDYQEDRKQFDLANAE